MALPRYRLYVDEVGNDDITNTNNEQHRYLGLTGIIMRQEYVRDDVTPVFTRWKAELFRHDPDSPVILHRKDIMNKRRLFEALRDPELCRRFDDRLIEFLMDTAFTAVTAVIDKKGMLNQRHWSEKHPYHYLMSILVEKYVQWLDRHNSMGDIMPEKRMGKQDEALQAAFTRITDQGTRYVDPDLIAKRIYVRQLKFRGKSENITGLQICDLIAHPSYVEIRRQQGHAVKLAPFGERIVSVLRELKYDRSPYNGRISGYGTKYLP